VREKLKINLNESQIFLDKYNQWLWDATQYYLADYADFSENEYAFTLHKNPFPSEFIDNGPYRIGKNIDDAHIYRPGHPLAEKILAELKISDTPNAHIEFDYSHHSGVISVLADLIGTSGYLTLSQLTVQSLEAEDSLVITGIDSDGNIIEPDVIKKIFSLSAIKTSETNIPTQIIEALETNQEKAINITVDQIARRNNSFFTVEMEKLDAWAEDKRRTLKSDLSSYEDEIAALKKAIRVSANLSDTFTMQKRVRELEIKHDSAWKEYDQAVRVINEQKDKLLDELEHKLHQTTTRLKLFTIGWKIV